MSAPSAERRSRWGGRGRAGRPVRSGHLPLLGPEAPDAPPAGMDAVSFLTVFVLLLFAVPSHMTISALGSLGDLSVLWGLAGLGWWTYVRLQHTSPVLRGTVPVKFVLLGFFAVVLFSYGMNQLSGPPPENAAWADSSLIRSLSWAGIGLVAIDGIPDRERFLLLVRRLVWAGALVACLGLAQFVTGQALIDSLTLPGFGSGPEYATVFDRAGFTRAAGTASHPLAYGSMLVTLLPLAVVTAIEDRHRHLVLRWGPTLLLAAAAMTSMSRSVLISAAFGLALILPVVPRRHRWTTAATAVVLIGIVAMLVPGMFSALRDMFTGQGSESSTSSRTDSAGPALEIALRHPWLGQGLGTFMPTELILDNQVLLMMIELGVLGLATFVLVVGTCVWTGITVWSHDPDSRMRASGVGLAAGTLSWFVNMLFYDALSFPMAAGLIFLMFGLCGVSLGLFRRGVSWRLDHRPIA